MIHELSVTRDLRVSTHSWVWVSTHQTDDPPVSTHTSPMSEYSLVSVSEYSLNRWSSNEYSHVTYEWVLTCECEWVLTKQMILQWALTYTWSITYQSHVIYEYSHLILRNKVGTCSSSNGSCTINNRPSHQYDAQTQTDKRLYIQLS